MSDGPSVSRVVGQLRYLFEERPELSGASAAELARWGGGGDPQAPPPAPDPRGTREAVEGAANQLDDRISEQLVAEALAQLRGAGA